LRVRTRKDAPKHDEQCVRCVPRPGAAFLSAASRIHADRNKKMLLKDARNSERMREFY
jgi:hypothetical protein